MGSVIVLFSSLELFSVTLAQEEVACASGLGKIASAISAKVGTDCTYVNVLHFGALGGVIIGLVLIGIGVVGRTLITSSSAR